MRKSILCFAIAAAAALSAGCDKAGIITSKEAEELNFLSGKFASYDENNGLADIEEITFTPYSKKQLVESKFGDFYACGDALIYCYSYLLAHPEQRYLGKDVEYHFAILGTNADGTINVMFHCKDQEDRYLAGKKERAIKKTGPKSFAMISVNFDGTRTHAYTKQ